MRGVVYVVKLVVVVCGWLVCVLCVWGCFLVVIVFLLVVGGGLLLCVCMLVFLVGCLGGVFVG